MAKQVLCTLENASEEINGVKFVKTKTGMVSEEIDDAIADNFASIDGFEIYQKQSRGRAGKPASVDGADAGGEQLGGEQTGGDQNSVDASKSA